MIYVVSVPHSGSMFVLQHLLRDFRDIFEKDLLHFMSEYVVKLTRAWDCSWIVPLRYPEAVALTWKGRGRDLRALPQAWEYLIEYSRVKTLHVIAIDGARREAQLRDVNQSLGLSLSTTWPVVGSQGKRAQLTVDEYRTCVMPFIDFYGAHS